MAGMRPIEIVLRAKDEASQVFDLLKRNAAAVGAAIAGYFGFNAFVGAIKGAADLEAALSEVKAVSGASADEMVRLRAAAEEAGANTQYTATQAATALGNLARSGLNASQAIQALPAVLQLSAAGGIALEQSATIVTRTLAGFNLEAGNAGRIADVLAKGANESNTSVHGLAEALSYAAPVAKSVGLSLEGTVAIIGKFADAGIDASRAGTALNAILSQFADPASKFKAELANLGITTSNFEKALVQLAASGAKGEKAILAVGTEAGPALRGLLNQGIGALTELKAKLSDAAGSAEATAKVMQDNLNGSIKGLGSAWDTLKNALMTPVLPVLKSSVDSLAASFKSAVDSGLITRFGEAIAKGFESAITWAKAFAAQVDFAALATKIEGYAAQAGQAFNDIKNAATTAGDVVRTAWGVMSAGANTVLTAVYGIGSAWATVASAVQSGVAVILESFSKLSFGAISQAFKAAAEEMRLSAAATGAAAQALKDKAAEAFEKVAAGAETARAGWAGLTAEAEASKPKIESAAAGLAATAKSLDDVGKAAEGAAAKSAKASDDQVKAAEAARAKVAELRAEYEKALKSGSWEKQVEALKALETAENAATVAARALNKETDDAAEKASKVKSAFAQMGIKTKEELADLAKVTKSQFDTIKESGQATAEGLQTAFKKAAEAAIAANKGIAPGWVQAEAAARGYKVVVDQAGKATLELAAANDKLTAGMAGVASAVDSVTSALERQNAALEQNIAAREKAIELAEREKRLKQQQTYGNVDADGFVNGSNGQRQTQYSDPIHLKVLKNIKRDQYGLYDPAEYARLYAMFKAQQDAELQAAADRGTESVKNPSRVPGSVGRTSAATSAVESSASGLQTAKTYNVQIGATTVRTVSDADAQALVGVLKAARASA